MPAGEEVAERIARQGIEVIHVDDWLLALNKPSGLLSVPGRGEDKRDCVAVRVQTACPEALTVHRLDMETSGILLMGRGPDAQRALSVAFQDRRVEKRYVAVVEGRLERPEGEIDLPLIADWPNRPRQKVDHAIGKPALTRFRLIGHEGERSRVELAPVTGRSHQLRVHLQSLGHPIAGDALYSSPPPPGARLLLHAEYLAFVHPFTGQRVEFHCPTPF